jgi:bacterioferritin (cytochrome b1)
MEHPPENIPSVEALEKEPGFKDLVLFTTTMYGEDAVSRVREVLAEDLLKNAEKLGVRCVVVDGGSNAEFLKKLSEFKNVTSEIDPKLGMGESRREALKKALEMAGPQDNFLWVEPEKADLITEESLNAMIEGLRAGKTDIVVPRRKSMESMPKFQAWIERRANQRAGELMKENEDEAEPTDEALDLWFGPKMFNRGGAAFFADYKGKLDKWDSIIKPVIEAAEAGKKISSVDVDYSYDPSQSGSEENDRVMKEKRVIQYKKILGELGDSFWEKK